MRQLRWKLTFSYTLVTVAALLVVELAFFAFAAVALLPVLRSPDPTVVASLVSSSASVTALQVRPYLDSETPDIEGMAAALAQLTPQLIPGSGQGASTQRVAQPEDLARLDLAVVVFDRHSRLLGSIPALPAGPTERSFPSSLVPGLAPALAAVLGGKEVVDLPPQAGGAYHLHATPVRGSDGRVVGAVVAFAKPGAVSATERAVVMKSIVLAAEALVAFLLLATIAGTIFGSLTARGLSRRIDRLERAAMAWSKGDFSAFVEDRSGDELGRLTQTLNGMAQQLQNLLDVRQELAGLRERERLARELHDSVKQQIFATAMQLGAAQASLERDPAAVRLRLQQARESTAQAQHDLALLIQEMRPAGVPEGGLARALDKYLAAWSRQSGVEVVSAPPDAPIVVDNAVELAMYRVAQEALSNVARHSHARRAWVELACTPEELVLRIRDDGQGFDVAAARGQGIGLSSMSERLEALGGALEIRSAPGQGAELVAHCPVAPASRPGAGRRAEKSVAAGREVAA